ncbi:hypothetical protein [Saccharopolyspora aridisoli]|nr:hypothetical protein [Saccharopolyspora aridisoli]
MTSPLALGLQAEEAVVPVELTSFVPPVVATALSHFDRTEQR